MRGPFLALVTVAILVGLVCSGVVCWTPEKQGWEPPELLVREPEEALRVREGQLVIVGLPGTTLDPLTKDALARGHVAGVILMARNIEDTAQVRSLCRDIYLAVPPEEPPPIICVDQEGGRVSRLNALGVPDWGAVRYLTRQGEQVTKEYSQKIGEFLVDLHINVNLAPVLDVLTNPSNEAIGNRSFGSDPDDVSRFGRAMIQGLEAGGVAPVGKHFPGHGASSQDPHTAQAVVDVSADDMRSIHARPFVEAWESGLDATMVAHITYTALDAGRPASRSPLILKDFMRGELGYNGVIVSDAVNMAGFAAENQSIPDACVEAIDAGCDLIIDPRTVDQVDPTFFALRRAAVTGRIDQDQMLASAERVRAWRATLHDPR